MEEKKISDVVFDFIENMDALNESTPLVLSTVATVASASHWTVTFFGSC